MNNINKVVFDIADDMHKALMKHKPTPEIAFACIGSLARQFAQKLCASLHSEVPAHTIAKYLHGVAGHIAANAKEYAKAKMPTEENLADFEKENHSHPKKAKHNTMTTQEFYDRIRPLIDEFENSEQSSSLLLIYVDDVNIRARIFGYVGEIAQAIKEISEDEKVYQKLMDYLQKP
ncbi:MAG: hypothetical protein IKO20_04070 [Bacteroidaceae bacterium]|nr:hypothetical protein [Bacteroidaceae bacterium]